MPKPNHLSLKSYFISILSTIFLGILAICILLLQLSNSNHDSHLSLSQKEAINIEKTIAESFGYSNKISVYIGKQIAQHGVKDLNFILKTFRQADNSQNQNKYLLSWSSFDFVSSNDLQLVNSKVGIRKNPPNMSERQYVQRSREKPWTLQVSFPVFGNPSQSWVIPAGTGITDDQGNYLGAIVIGFNIAELTNFVEKRLNNQTSFVVLDENLNVIIQSKDSEINQDPLIYRKIFSKFTFSNKSAGFSNKIHVGQIRYFYYQKFDDYPYIVLTGFNQSILNQEFSKSVLPLLFGLIMMTLFFLVILFAFKTKVSFLINREKLLSQSLQKSNQSKINLIRATSHDLKNYIFGISGLSKLILQSKSRTEIEENEDLKMVEELHLQSEEMMGFVEDLLDTNQNEDGEFSLNNKQICDIIEITKRIIILNKNFAIENRINLEFENKTNRKSINIECDIRRLKQILNNVLINAVKYSNQNSIVLLQIDASETNQQVNISVIDQGIGMTNSEIAMALNGEGAKIIKNGLKKEFDSHGLGIPIIRKLVELNNGNLEIGSIKGFGTEVKISFPISDNKNFEPNYNENCFDNKFKNKAVLIAEDNSITNKVISFFLRKMGFNVKHVENGEEILQNLEKQHFDLVIVDINMPKLGGFETAKIIREGKIFKRFKNYEIPIIAISTEKQELSQLKDSGINMLLGKPFSEKELIDFIIGYID